MSELLNVCPLAHGMRWSIWIRRNVEAGYYSAWGGEFHLPFWSLLLSESGVDQDVALWAVELVVSRPGSIHGCSTTTSSAAVARSAEAAAQVALSNLSPESIAAILECDSKDPDGSSCTASRESEL